MSLVTRLCRAFPQENGEVTEDLHSYESTRCPPWPANSFMVSVTDPVGAHRCVLTPLRVNTT
ncbi:hypothetical protein F7R91_04155 [Streptomyces luteolifulvus]|uniref:Uncharacterized protein n=1 Tax=Streptomyces luteolifulvus TaxID=2615112 RepID=A0A6H9V778_9ACTN|nr:hypothetical protein F7R91_04155 [Streptomyces luteolifulvus]MXM63871.1 hypothetical protein [Streptomyces sp. HUCO-GS316]